MKRHLKALGFLGLLTSSPVGLLAQGGPSDKILLRDGQVLSGALVNPDFKFSTIYGNVTVPNSACQSLERKDDKIEVLSTVNKETITGYLDQPVVEIQLAGGPRVPVAKDLISRLVFGSRERSATTSLDYFQMKNGDSFYGKVLDRGFSFTTSYGALDTSFASLLKLEDQNGQTVMYLSDGSTVMGYIASASFRVETNYGFVLSIPKSSIKLVQMRR